MYMAAGWGGGFFLCTRFQSPSQVQVGGLLTRNVAPASTPAPDLLSGNLSSGCSEFQGCVSLGTWVILPLWAVPVGWGRPRTCY